MAVVDWPTMNDVRVDDHCRRCGRKIGDHVVPVLADECVWLPIARTTGPEESERLFIDGIWTDEQTEAHLRWHRPERFVSDGTHNVRRLVTLLGRNR